MPNERFASLDAARGLGAFSVVLWHWSHFSFHGTQPGPVAQSAQPLYSLFSLIYRYGWLGVDFFFVLSGFIFCYFYYDSVRNRQITAAEFGRRRFARLYPLYSFTLFLVIILQSIFFYRYGSTFVYPAGNLGDLIQAITLTSHWWPNPGFYFNGPGWSISVECFLYIVFFIAARWIIGPRAVVFLTLALIGLVLNIVHWPIGRGLMSFFSGALMAQALMILTRQSWFNRNSLNVLAITIGVGGAMVLGLVAIPFVLDAAAKTFPRAPGVAGSLVRNIVVVLLFPYLAFLLALIDRIRPTRIIALRLLGDCSYSIYLLHFPLQLVTVLVVEWMGFRQTLFLQPAFFIAWCMLLFALGAASYYGFEKPMQRRFRTSAMPFAASAPSTVS